MVTQKEIARRCKVSVSAVSAAFRRPEMISADTYERIMKTARELGYFAKRNPNPCLGLLTGNLTAVGPSELEQAILTGILQRSAELKTRLQIFSQLPNQAADTSEIGGLLILSKLLPEAFSQLNSVQFPVLLLQPSSPFFTGHTLYFDLLSGIRQSLDYVLNCGHLQVAVFHNDLESSSSLALNLRKLLEETYQRHHLPASGLRFFQVTEDSQTVELVFTQLLSQKPFPSCLLCTDDATAYILYQLAAKYGLKIPQDFSVTGLGGIALPPYLHVPEPRLTTVSVSPTQLGRTAVDTLLDLLDGKSMANEILLETTLLINHSVRRISTSNWAMMSL